MQTELDSENVALDAGIDVIRVAPLNGETPADALTAAVTPTAHAYVRTNFGVPALDPQTHRIEIAGAIRAPFSVGRADLAELEQVTLLSTMECAGNDRTAIVPPVDGEPWTGGAVSTVRWGGVPLRVILDRAGVDKSAIGVLFEGADRGPVASAGRAVSFARALPLDDALHPETLLAITMNGEPLRPRYGAPVRLVVPGWFGMASVKWLRRIEVITQPFDGYFQTQRYVYDDGHAITPVTRMRVKSLVVDPPAGAVIPPGRVPISGWAWSGDGEVVAVDVDAGPLAGTAEWLPATLERQESATAWVRWTVEVPLDRPGEWVLRSRARDTAGNTQPEAPVWNALGYGNNAIRETRVRVEGSPGR